MSVAQTTRSGHRTASGAEEEYIPAVVLDVEVSTPIPEIASVSETGRRRDRAWILVRLFGEPLGTVTLPIVGSVASASSVAAAIDEVHGDLIRQRVAAAGATLTGSLPVDGFTVPHVPPFLAGRAAVLKAAPPITVVISTRDRPATLERTVKALLAQQYPDFRIVIVDNAPSSSETRVFVSGLKDDRISYVVEPRPGLSWARNRGIAAATDELIAFIDDDEVPDRHWLAEVARGFVLHPQATAVSGVIVPAELETHSQDLFERYGGHSKGRGFTPAVFSPLTAIEQSPLYPLPPFGTGGNMAFRRSFLDKVGGFDVALGAGTPARGAEDTLILTQVLLDGGTIVYQPSALVWHYHRATPAGLRDVMEGYGIGLTAYYASLVMANPFKLGAILRLAPTALRDTFSRSGRKLGDVPVDFPRELLSVNRKGMLVGPYCYVLSRIRARRVRNRG